MGTCPDCGGPLIVEPRTYNAEDFAASIEHESDDLEVCPRCEAKKKAASKSTTPPESELVTH